MKNRFNSLGFRALAVAAVAGTVTGTAVAQPAIASDAQGEYVRGRLLVMPKAGLSDAELGKIVGAHGAHARALGRSRLFVVELPAQASEHALAQQLARHPLLKFAELDRRINPSLTPNDPYLGSQWHTAKIGAMSAWDVTQGSGVTIAVLDSGVDGGHPDLSARLVSGWNFYDNNANTDDVLGHGTAAAGTAAASLNNGTGVAGVAGQARIMPLRISDSTGAAYWSTVAQAINHAADNGARVASISYANLLQSSAVLSAAQYMKGKGGLVVISAGNNGVNENFTPSSNVISVSATDSTDAITSWSSYGPYVNISAPGQNIWTTNRGGGYGAWWGTSFSTPTVAGTIALIMATKPSLTPAQVENILYSTATDLGAAGRDIYYGWGRVNASAAVQAASSTTSTADTSPPTVAVASPATSTSVSGLVSVSVDAADNVNVTKVDLRVNGALVASDTSAPFGFSWDSRTMSNGTASLTAVAYDAAGNVATSAPVTVNVYNGSAAVADTAPPAVALLNPVAGMSITGNSVTVSASATDNSGTAGITQSLYIDGALKATATGGSLNYRWNTRKIASGAHTVEVVARDAAGNSSKATVQVAR